MTEDVMTVRRAAPPAGDAGTAVSRPVRAEWRRWTGANLDAIRDLAAGEYAGLDGDTVRIRFGDTRYVQPLHPGWYLVRYEGDGYVRVMSERYFTETLQVTSAGEAGDDR